MDVHQGSGRRCYASATRFAKMGAMPTLSDRKIRDTKPGTKEVWLSDGNGLVIRIYKSGKKTWFIRRKNNGKTTTETLGDFPEMSCADARKAFVNKSFQPSTSKMTFGDLLDDWYKKRIEPRYKITKNINVYVNRTKEKFGSIILGKLSTPDLVRWLQTYAANSPIAANRCSSTIKLALNYAVECGYLERNPLVSVTKRVVGGTEKTRNRVLSDEEIIKLWNSDHKHAPLLRFLLLTGLRISEAQAARSEHIDGNILRIDKNKSDRPHWVWLTKEALAQTGKFNGFLFEHISPTAVQSRLKRSNVNWTPHDLRRTFATRVAETTPPHVVEKLLNHSMQGVAAIYNRHDYQNERIAATQTWSDTLLQLISDNKT
jgi:integrase